MSQNWQASWEETIKNSRRKYRRNDISDREITNLSAEIWHKNCYRKKDLNNLQESPEYEAELNRLRRFITRDSSVLDIGAGFGRVAVPLAKEVRRMTAIEPARIYMKIMKDKAIRCGVVNMDFFEDLWCDFQLSEKYDLVYSTWSLAMMDPTSLLKMHEASRGYCAIEILASSTKIWDFAGQIYPMILGEDFESPGNYLNIITTLFDHGIYANLETWKFDREIKYHTMSEAIDLWMMKLGNYVQVSEEIEKKLKQYYRSKMNPDGSYVFSLRGGVACMIWWHV